MTASVELLLNGASEEAIALAEAIAVYARAPKRRVSRLSANFPIPSYLRAALEVLDKRISLSAVYNGTDGFISRG
jgi:hypothetical protein